MAVLTTPLLAGGRWSQALSSLSAFQGQDRDRQWGHFQADALLEPFTLVPRTVLGQSWWAKVTSKEFMVEENSFKVPAHQNWEPSWGFHSFLLFYK